MTSASFVESGVVASTVTFSCSPAARTIFSRKSRRLSAAALRSRCPSLMRSNVIRRVFQRNRRGGAGIARRSPRADATRALQSGSLRTRVQGRWIQPSRFLSLGRLGRRRRHRMSLVQPPLLPDTYEATGKNIYRKSTRDGRDHENTSHRYRHDLHHGLLL